MLEGEPARKKRNLNLGTQEREKSPTKGVLQCVLKQIPECTINRHCLHNGVWVRWGLYGVSVTWYNICKISSTSNFLPWPTTRSKGVSSGRRNLMKRGKQSYLSNITFFLIILYVNNLLLAKTKLNQNIYHQHLPHAQRSQCFTETISVSNHNEQIFE